MEENGFCLFVAIAKD